MKRIDSGNLYEYAVTAIKRAAAKSRDRAAKAGNVEGREKGDCFVWIRRPIPVMSVKGYCDIEISFDTITISTKLRRNAALAYSFEKRLQYDYEAYGVEDYLADYYHTGQTVQDLKDNIAKSDEKEIGFSFRFPFDVEGKQIFEFVKLLRHEGFYY